MSRPDTYTHSHIHTSMCTGLSIQYYQLNLIANASEMNLGCGKAFNLRHSVSIDKAFNWLTVCDLASIKVTGGRYVSKLLILLCNSKTIEARTFAGHTLLGYFLVYFNLDSEILILSNMADQWPYLLLVNHIFALLLNNYRRLAFCLKYILRLFFGVV